MNGVKILNSYEYLTNVASIIGANILFVVCLIASIFILIKLLKYKSIFSWREFAIFFILVLLTITFGCLIPKEKYETNYQVMVDDSVSMNEFQSKYEIIKVEGNIYTVKDRVK